MCFKGQFFITIRPKVCTHIETGEVNIRITKQFVYQVSIRQRGDIYHSFHCFLRCDFRGFMDFRIGIVKNVSLALISGGIHNVIDVIYEGGNKISLFFGIDVILNCHSDIAFVTVFRVA